jgi:drug/metabolite transporter (DMT)-like permease
MKLNFWQWIGVALLVLGAIWLIKREFGKPATPNKGTPATQPSSAY